MPLSGSVRTQVLVVGAGPVGLLAAVRLRQRGVTVRIVEQQSEERTRSFPVVLHPHSLRLLNELGLAPALFWRGRPVTRLAVYTEYERRAVLDLPKVNGVAPGLLTLPQDVVRQTLLNALDRAGVAVEWNTRLTMLSQDDHGVWGRLLRDEPASSVRPGSSEVESFDADYVIGADGYESTVREALGLPLVEHGGLTTFAFFDTLTHRSGREAQLALSEDFANAVYPLQDSIVRFSFQIQRGLSRAPDVQLLKELLAARLPWYAAELERCAWCGVAEFRKALVTRFGLGRVWLAGEAAHLTGPLGVHSLNIGLDEANELASSMADALEDSSSRDFGPEYDARRGLQWRELLGLEQRAEFSSRSPEWARRNLSRLIPCLPAADGDLDDLLDQLRVAPVSHAPEV
jgi:2-polyprenyl-6-methoxyphenol hydroxylase-like FAD-dependent oxidoreductase